jgi:hypothetical protein
MRLLLVACLLLGISTITAKAELLESYVALLSERDHFNSSGKRLTSAAAIIRQDRANFHRFNRGDAADEWDSFFGSSENRARLERMLNNGSASRATLRRIVNGTPMIRVDIYRNSVDVAVF